MQKHLIPLLIVAYIFGGIVSYGHHFQNGARTYIAYDHKEYVMHTEQRVISSFFCALFWPLYASSVAFEKDAK